MRTILAIVLFVGSFSAQTAQTPAKSVPAQGPPPKKLTVRPDGHVTANQDPANPDKFEVHIVKKGETLSQISGEVLKNPGCGHSFGSRTSTSSIPIGFTRTIRF